MSSAKFAESATASTLSHICEQIGEDRTAIRTKVTLVKHFLKVRFAYDNSYEILWRAKFSETLAWSEIPRTRFPRDAAHLILTFRMILVAEILEEVNGKCTSRLGGIGFVSCPRHTQTVRIALVDLPLARELSGFG